MILVRFSQSHAHLDEPKEDVRGLPVKDAKGQEIGSVTDLLFDLETKTVRFLEIGSGGFLGLGERHFIVGAPDVKRIDSVIKLDVTHEQIVKQPEGSTVHPMATGAVRVKAGEMGRQMETTEKPMGTGPRFGVLPTVGTATEKGQMGTETGRTMTGTAPMVKESTPMEKEHVHKERTPTEKVGTHQETTPMEKQHMPTEVGAKGMTKESMSSLVGKTAQRRVRAADGTVIVEKGDKITAKDLHNAEKHQAVDMLMNAVGMKH